MCPGKKIQIKESSELSVLELSGADYNDTERFTTNVKNIQLIILFVIHTKTIVLHSNQSTNSKYNAIQNTNLPCPSVDLLQTVILVLLHLVQNPGHLQENRVCIYLWLRAIVFCNHWKLL